MTINNKVKKYSTKQLNDIGFAFNVKVELVHQVKNDYFKTRHHSNHDPCIFVLESRVKKTFKIKKSKIFNEEEFS